MNGWRSTAAISAGAAPVLRRLSLGCVLLVFFVAWPSRAEGKRKNHRAAAERQSLIQRGWQRAREWRAAARMAKSLRAETLGLQPSQRQNAGDRVARKRLDEATRLSKRVLLGSGTLLLIAAGLVVDHIWGTQEPAVVSHIIDWALANPREAGWLIAKNSHAVWPAAVAGLLSGLGLRLTARTERVVRLHQARRHGKELSDNTVRWLDRQLRKRKWRGQKVIELQTDNTSAAPADPGGPGAEVFHLNRYLDKAAAR